MSMPSAHYWILLLDERDACERTTCGEQLNGSGMSGCQTCYLLITQTMTPSPLPSLATCNDMMAGDIIMILSVSILNCCDALKWIVTLLCSVFLAHFPRAFPSLPKENLSPLQDNLYFMQCHCQLKHLVEEPGRSSYHFLPCNCNFGILE